MLSSQRRAGWEPIMLCREADNTVEAIQMQWIYCTAAVPNLFQLRAHIRIKKMCGPHSTINNTEYRPLSRTVMTVAKEDQDRKRGSNKKKCPHKS